MAYTVINNADIQAGQPTKEEIFQTIRDNQESFNTDIEALKQTSKIDILNYNLTGYLSDYTFNELLDVSPVFTAPISGTIVNVRASLLESSTSGTLAYIIEKSTDNGANWSSILSANVDLTGTVSGSQSGSVNFISTATQEFAQGDMIRVSIQTLQVDQGSVHFSIYGEVS